MPRVPKVWLLHRAGVRCRGSREAGRNVLLLRHTRNRSRWGWPMSLGFKACLSKCDKCSHYCWGWEGEVGHRCREHSSAVEANKGGA